MASNTSRKPLWSRLSQLLSGNPLQEKATSTAAGSELLWLGPASQAYPLFASSTDPLAFVVNTCVNACVGEIMGAVASARFIVEKRVRGEWVRVEDHPLAILLDYVNAADDQFTLLEGTSGWLALNGNAMWRLAFAGKASAPVAIQPLPANTMSALPPDSEHQGLTSGYEMLLPNGQKQRFDAKEIVHFKFFGASDPAFGVSPSRVLETAINTYSAADNFNLAFYRGGGVPSALLVSDQELDETQVAQIQARYQAWRAQARSDNRPLVTGKGAHLEVPGTNPDAVTVSELPLALSKRICSVLHVPPPLVGILDDATYSNYKEALRQFYRGTVTQYWQRIISAINEQLCPLFGKDIRVGFDTAHIAALQPDYVEMSAAARNLVGILKVDEIRESLFGLPAWGGEWGQGAWGPLMQVQLADGEGNAVGYTPAPTAPAAAPSAASGAEPKAHPRAKTPKVLRRLSGAARVAHYKGFNARRDREASRVRATVAQWYDGLEADVLARLESNKALLASRVKAPALASLLFSAADGEKDLSARIIPVLADLFQRTGQQALAEIAVGLSFSLENPRAREILAQRTLEMKTVTATAQESCRASLAEGLANGETIEQLTTRVEQWAEAGRIGHAENVARTETGVCMNQASLEGYREGGAQSKEWLSISDERSREWHASMDGVIVGIDENFELETGSFNGPGDPSMDAADACRCRCAIAPVVESADGTVTEGDPVGGAEE